jgi:hypothetical protein
MMAIRFFSFCCTQHHREKVLETTEGCSSTANSKVKEGWDHFDNIGSCHGIMVTSSAVNELVMVLQYGCTPKSHSHSLDRLS